MHKYSNENSNFMGYINSADMSISRLLKRDSTDYEIWAYAN